ncbi:SLAM family member 6, partial [Fukomys damarensis]
VSTGNTVSQSRSTPMVVNGVVGESVTLPLDFPEEDIKVVVWLRNTTVITIHMPPGSTKILNPNFKCKEELNFTQSCSLHFCNLTKADSGPYQAQINSNTFFHYVLRVFAETSEDIELASISPGSTVYAQVTHPYREMEILTHIKSSDSVTIYSTINHSKQVKL